MPEVVDLINKGDWDELPVEDAKAYFVAPVWTLRRNWPGGRSTHRPSRPRRSSSTCGPCRGFGDSGTDGRRAVAAATLSEIRVLGFERIEYELTREAVDLGLDTALPRTMRLRCSIDEFGRGERSRTRANQLIRGCFVEVDLGAETLLALTA